MRLFRRRKPSSDERAAQASAPTSPTQSVTSAPAEPGATDTPSTKKRRKRGSRGGRNRKRTTSTAAKPETEAKPKEETRPERKPAARRQQKPQQRRRTPPRRPPLPPAKRELIISVDVSEQRVAVVEDERVAEAYLERPERRSIAGNIYKGVVDNVLPGMEAAFIEIGLEKNGFLYVDEVVVPELEGRSRGRPVGGPDASPPHSRLTDGPAAQSGGCGRPAGGDAVGPGRPGWDEFGTKFGMGVRFFVGISM